jgi:hypothetical protein
MVAHINRLVDFEELMDPIVLCIRPGRPDIEVVWLEYASKVDDNRGRRPGRMAPKYSPGRNT